MERGLGPAYHIEAHVLEWDGYWQLDAARVMSPSNTAAIRDELARVSALFEDNQAADFDCDVHGTDDPTIYQQH